MPNDFGDAAERHWEDAGHLLHDARIANADHLFGLAAECGIKAVMRGLGMAMNPRNPDKPQDPYAVHINLLWEAFVSFAHTRGGARYALDFSAKPNPFVDWHINQRYRHRAGITQAAVENHRQGARTVMNAFKTAVLDGVIT